MKFISKLYFNTFKRIGNLRFMFVTSCLFGLISLWLVTSNALYNVKFINIKDVTIEQTLDSYTAYSKHFVWGTKLKDYVDIYLKKDAEYSEEGLTHEIITAKYCQYNMTKEAFAFAEKHFNNVGKNKSITSEKELCRDAENKFGTMYAFSYLWNYLWVVFWFYLPFLIVLPIKFIVDGYSEDKKDKK